MFTGTVNEVGEFVRDGAIEVIAVIKPDLLQFVEDVVVVVDAKRRYGITPARVEVRGDVSHGLQSLQSRCVTRSPTGALGPFRMVISYGAGVWPQASHDANDPTRFLTRGIVPCVMGMTMF